MASISSCPKDWEMRALSKMWFTRIMYRMISRDMYQGPSLRRDVQLSKVISCKASINYSCIELLCLPFKVYATKENTKNDITDSDSRGNTLRTTCQIFLHKLITSLIRKILEQQRM